MGSTGLPILILHTEERRFPRTLKLSFPASGHSVRGILGFIRKLPFVEELEKRPSALRFHHA